MALLQHLSQQFPNSVFGSPETRGSGSWSRVWSQHSALQQASRAGARGAGDEPRGSRVWKGGRTPCAGAEYSYCSGAGLVPVLISNEIQPSYE